MAEYRYRVRTVCTATVEEVWTVTSPVPLTEEQVENAVIGGEFNDDDPVEAGIFIECQDEEISDEHDRSVCEISTLEAQS